MFLWKIFGYPPERGWGIDSSIERKLHRALEEKFGEKTFTEDQAKQLFAEKFKAKKIGSEKNHGFEIYFRRLNCNFSIRVVGDTGK